MVEDLSCGISHHELRHRSFISPQMMQISRVKLAEGNPESLPRPAGLPSVLQYIFTDEKQQQSPRQAMNPVRHRVG